MTDLKIRCFRISSVCRYCMCLFVLLIFFACSIRAFAYPRTDDDLIEMTCGETDSTYVLIAYDTIHGSTAEVGDRIGENLCDQGFRVDLRLAAHVEDTVVVTESGPKILTRANTARAV